MNKIYCKVILKVRLHFDFINKVIRYIYPQNAAKCATWLVKIQILSAYRLLY